MNVRKVLTRMPALLLVVFCVAVAAQAQPVHLKPMIKKQLLGEQLALSLASPNTEIKIIALDNTVFFASLHDATLNLKPAIPVLAKIYRYDPDESCRLAAVAGLQYIGDFNSMMALRDGLRFQHAKAVQWVALETLLDYFGPDDFTKDTEMMELTRALIR